MESNTTETGQRASHKQGANIRIVHVEDIQGKREYDGETGRDMRYITKFAWTVVRNR